MKYVKILEQKGLKKEDLAKQTQKKIDQLESLKSQLDEFDQDDFDEDDRDKYDFIKNSILELDIELERNIRKFDVEIYKKRLEVFEQNKKQGKSQDSENQQEIVDSQMEIEVTKVNEVIEIENEVNLDWKEQDNTLSVKPDTTKVDSIRGKLASLKKELNVNPKKFEEDTIARNEQQIQEVEVEEEVEEFEKKANVKPKKGSLSIILMTLGFGILTFGSVIYFKERK
jgi:thiol:disulfide interchange protein